MLNLILFNVALLAAALYAGWRGGAPERLTAASLTVAALLTRLSYSGWPRRFDAVEYGVLTIDAALLAILTAIALRSNRFWPMGLAALQLSSLVVHVARLIDPHMAAWVYAFMLKLWAYPMVVALVVGTMRHRRRLKRHGIDLPWSES